MQARLAGRDGVHSEEGYDGERPGPAPAADAVKVMAVNRLSLANATRARNRRG